MKILLAVAFAIYFTATVMYLDRFPLVGQDEPWIAAPAYKLATEGVLGSDMFAGFHGMERHHLVHMPVYAIAEAAIFRMFGTGVVQMRILSVVFGFGLLLLVFAVGREFGGCRVGTVAALIMVVFRLSVPTEIRPIGILLLDDARINRYDIAVPVFGLVAFWACIKAARRSGSKLYVTAGGLVGLATLSHAYGVFWLPALASMLAVRDGLQRSTARSISLIGDGLALICTPWLVWVLMNRSDFIAQMRTVGARLDVFSPSFYFENIISGDGPISLRWLMVTIAALPLNRVGAWTLIFGLPAAVFMLIRRSRSRHSMEMALLITGSVQTVLFITLLRVKSFNYVIAIWPLAAIALAWLAVNLWDDGSRTVRVALVLLAAVIFSEGGAQLVTTARQGRTASSYDVFEARVAQCIPSDARVLGFQHYWLGLRQFEFRSWLLPIFKSTPGFESTPISLDAALETVGPDIVLIDRVARQLFAETADPSHPYHQLAVGYEAFRAHHEFVRRCVVDDRSYGTMEVFEVRR